MDFKESDDVVVAYKTPAAKNGITLEDVASPLSDDQTDCAVVAISASAAISVSPTHSSAISSDGQSSSNVLIMSLAPEESSPLRETRNDPFLRPRWLRYTDGLCIIITTMIIVAISVTVALVIQIVTGARQIIPHGGLISSNPNCSELGVKLLNSSEASSADAAVLAALCLCISHPQAASLGGGGFALVHNQRDANNATHMFNFREQSSSAFLNATTVETYFTGNTPTQVAQEKSIAVPGLVKGLFALHKQHGKMPWKKLVGMASKLAADGIKVSPNLAQAIHNLDINNTSAELRGLTTKDDNTTKLKEGDVLKQPLLASTLQGIADDADSMYSGNMAAQLASELNTRGSLVTADDLRAYNVTDTYAVPHSVYGDMEVWVAASPTFGFILHAVLETMSQFSISVSSDTGRYLQLHRLIESLKYGFSLLSQMGGETGNKNVTNFLNMEPNQTLGAYIASKINDSWSYDLQHYLNDFQPVVLTSRGQEYVSVVGPDGYIVSIAMSLGLEFGSQRMTMGFVLNNAMLDFSWSGKTNSSLQVSQTNYITGGVKPLSSLLPTIITPSTSKCGNYTIPGTTPGYVSVSGLAQFVLNRAQKYSYKDSISLPRLHQQLDPYPVQLENSEPNELETFLKDRGHNVTRLNSTLGEVNILLWTQSEVTSFIDPRNNHTKPYHF